MAERRRQGSSGAEERVTQYRRRAAGESQHGDSRPQNGQGAGSKASALHKPVIGNNE
jgi:hypothetical protein